MRQKLFLFFLSLLFAFFFLLFTYIVKKDILKQFDFDYAVKIQDRIPEGFYGVLATVSIAAQAEVLFFALLVLSIILILRKKFLSFFILLFFVLGHFVELFGKLLLEQPRPPFMFYKHETIQVFPQWHTVPGSSYPSGHAFRSVFVFIVLGYLALKAKNPLLRVLAVSFLGSWAGLVILSKIWLGEHWPSDVLGGALLGAVFGFFSLLFL